jgi:flagella basal body P-ring formation protein FlgA
VSNWQLLAGVALSLAAQAGDCIRVDGDRILARHLATAAAGLEAVPPETFIGFSPKPGVVRWLAPALIEASGARFGVKLQVPGPLCVERQAGPLTAAMIRQAIEAAMATAGYSNYKLQIVSFPEHPLPVGELEFPLSGLAAGPGKAAESMWRGRLKLAGSQSIPIPVRVTVSVETEELRATRLIRSGEILSADDLSIVRRSRLPGRKLTRMEISEASGMQARRRIEAGQAVAPGMLAAPPEIRKGDSVLVTVAAGGASLGIHARAETMARKGQPVVLTNPSSGKKFTARATGRGQAVVDLELSSHEASSTDGPAGTAGADAGAGEAWRQETTGGVGVRQDHR